MTTEPLLRPDDVRAWDAWMRAARIHQRSVGYRRAVEGARRLVAQALAHGAKLSASISGGKDSTALAVLLAEEGAPVELLSEKDDLDYPGEESYVRALAERTGLPLEIWRPEVDPVAWLQARAGRMSGGDDQHSRRSGMARASFYDVMAAADAAGRFDVAFWGLRAEESRRRERLLRTRSPCYRVVSGQWRCHPLAWWTGLDVYAFMEARGIEPFDVYRCCGFLPEHRRDPSRIRKSWWIPGAHAAHGQAAWLRHYYPTLFARFKAWFPDASVFA